MDRDPTIYLDNAVPRCSAVTGCAKASACARRMATVPVNGKVEDYSEAAHVIGECSRYTPIVRGYRAPASAPVVKDWPEGA